MAVVAAIAIGVVALVLMAFIVQLGFAVKKAHKDIARANFIAGQSYQALLEAASSPLVDQSTQSVLAVTLHNLQKERKELA